MAISPETGKAVRELGYPVAAEADVFTEDGLIDAVVRLANPSATAGSLQVLHGVEGEVADDPGGEEPEDVDDRERAAAERERRRRGRAGK